MENAASEIREDKNEWIPCFHLLRLQESTRLSDELKERCHMLILLLVSSLLPCKVRQISWLVENKKSLKTECSSKVKITQQLKRSPNSVGLMQIFFYLLLECNYFFFNPKKIQMHWFWAILFLHNLLVIKK
jgi:hypothetical protein